MYFYRVKKISSDEYHVIETRFVNEPEFILAKCSGPVPAGDIVYAMKLAQKIKLKQESIDSAITSIQMGLDMFKQETKFPD